MLKKLYRICRAAVVKKRFVRSAEFMGERCTFMATARCQNTGVKQNVLIGDHCTIGALFQALYGGKIRVGSNTYIGPRTILQAKESIQIGENVIIANNVVIVDNNNHPVSPEMRLQMSCCDDYMTDELWSWKYAESKPVVIEDNVWIGRDARILKGVRIGSGSIVGMGAVVTHDVPPRVIVAGNPAKIVKELD